MTTHQEDTATIERYRNSEDDQRTYLFLSHPLLREEFTAIDMENFNKPRRPGKAAGVNRWRLPLKLIFRRWSRQDSLTR